MDPVHVHQHDDVTWNVAPDMQRVRIVVKEYPTVPPNVLLNVLTAILIIIYALIGLIALVYIGFRFNVHRFVINCFVFCKLMFLYIKNGHLKRQDAPKDV